MIPKGPGKKDETPALRVVCAWCGVVEARPPEGTPLPALPVSHTICAVCFARERAEVERVMKGRRRKSSA